MEKLLDALRETLAQLGLDEKAIEAALQEAVAKAEGQPGEGDPAQSTDKSDVSQTPPAEDNAEGATDVPPSGEGTTVEGEPGAVGDVPPSDVQTNPGPTDVPPAVPPFDPTDLINQVNTLQGSLDEEIKANEGLNARIKALEEALTKAGVIDGTTPTVEVGDQLPSAAPTNPTEDVLANVLDEINPKKHY